MPTRQHATMPRCRVYCVAVLEHLVHLENRMYRRELTRLNDCVACRREIIIGFTSGMAQSQLHMPRISIRCG